jgi:hypothetical protein
VPLQRQFSDATVDMLAKQVEAGTALGKTTSAAERARPDVSLAADLAALEMETRPDHLGPATTDFELTLSDEDGAPGTVRAHRAILVARSAYLRELVLAAPDEDAMGQDEDPHSMPVPDTLDLVELRAAVRIVMGHRVIQRFRRRLV